MLGSSSIGFFSKRKDFNFRYWASRMDVFRHGFPFDSPLPALVVQMLFVETLKLNRGERNKRYNCRLHCDVLQLINEDPLEDVLYACQIWKMGAT